MNQETTDKDWAPRVRVLDHTEIALLSKNALELRELMSSYSVDKPRYQVTAENLDIVFANWLGDSHRKMAESNLIAVLGITFGNCLCDRLSMQWVEVTDRAGTTYAVRHETAEAYCFPLEAVKKRLLSGDVGFFAGIERAVREDISKPSTKQRSPLR